MFSGSRDCGIGRRTGATAACHTGLQVQAWGSQKPEPEGGDKRPKPPRSFRFDLAIPRHLFTSARSGWVTERIPFQRHGSKVRNQQKENAGSTQRLRRTARPQQKTGKNKIPGQITFILWTFTLMGDPWRGKSVNTRPQGRSPIHDPQRPFAVLPYPPPNATNVAGATSLPPSWLRGFV